MVTVATLRVCQLAEPKKRLILEGGCEKSKSRAEPPRGESAHIELLACNLSDSVFISLMRAALSPCSAQTPPSQLHRGAPGELVCLHGSKTPCGQPETV